MLKMVLSFLIIYKSRLKYLLINSFGSPLIYDLFYYCFQFPTSYSTQNNFFCPFVKNFLSLKTFLSLPFLLIQIEGLSFNHLQKKRHSILSSIKTYTTFNQEFPTRWGSDNLQNLFVPLYELYLMLGSWGLESSVIKQKSQYLLLLMWYLHLQLWYLEERLKFKGHFETFLHYWLFIVDSHYHQFSWTYAFYF